MERLVEVKDASSRLGIPGVTIVLRSERQQWEGVTDNQGFWRVKDPPSSAVVLIATCAQGFVMDTPRLVELSTEPIVLSWFREVRLSGHVRDTQGGSIAGAAIYLASPSWERHRAIAPAWKRIATTDDAGLYTLALREGWSDGGVVIAAHPSFVTAHRELNVPSSSSIKVDFELGQGIAWEIRVLDHMSAPCAGVRLRVMTDTSPASRWWVPDDVPAGAGEETGLVARATTTDSSGVALVSNWPANRTARVVVFSSSSAQVRVIEASSGTVREGRRISGVLASGETSLQLKVEVTLKDTIVVAGSLVGFSPEELTEVRLVRSIGDSARQVGRLRSREDGTFEATFPLMESDNRNRVELNLSVENPLSGWRRELGSFVLLSDLRLGSLVVSRQ